MWTLLTWSPQIGISVLPPVILENHFIYLFFCLHICKVGMITTSMQPSCEVKWNTSVWIPAYGRCIVNSGNWSSLPLLSLSESHYCCEKFKELGYWKLFEIHWRLLKFCVFSNTICSGFSAGWTAHLSQSTGLTNSMLTSMSYALITFPSLEQNTLLFKRRGFYLPQVSEGSVHDKLASRQKHHSWRVHQRKDAWLMMTRK